MTDLSAFDGCTAVAGDLVVNQYAGPDLQPLHCMELVSGKLVVLNSPGLTSLDGLDSLQKVGGNLGIGFAEQLIETNDSMTRIDALQVVGGNLSLFLKQVHTLDGLQALRVIGGGLNLSGYYLAAATDNGGTPAGVPIDDISGLANLWLVGGTLDIGQGVRSTAGLDTLAEIGGDLSVRDANALSEVSGFPALTCIGRTFQVGGPESWERNDVVQGVAGFPLLASIG